MHFLGRRPGNSSVSRLIQRRVIITVTSEAELDPFPRMPLGALKLTGGMFPVTSSLKLARAWGADDISAVAKSDLRLLKSAFNLSAEALDLEEYKNEATRYFFEEDGISEDDGIAQNVGIVMALGGKGGVVAHLPSEVVTDVSLASLEKLHLSSGGFATVMCVKGKNGSNLRCPRGYRPTELALLDPKRFPDTVDRRASLLDVLEEHRSEVACYAYDGLYWRFDSFDDYLLIEGKL